MPKPTPLENQALIKAQDPYSMTDEQLKQLLIQQYQESDADSVAGIAQQQQAAALAHQAAGEQTNTRALHGLLDSWYGGNTAQNYKPDTIDEAALMKGLQDSKDKLADRRNKTLKELLEAKKADKADKRDERMMISKRNEKEKEFRGQIIKTNDISSKFNREYGTIKQALDRGSAFSLGQVDVFMSRLLGGTGVTTDKDAEKAIPLTMNDLSARVRAKLLSDPTAKADPATIAELKITMEELKKNLGSVLKEKADNIKSLYTGGEVDISGGKYFKDQTDTLHKNINDGFFGKSAEASQEELLKKAVQDQMKELGL